MKRLSLSVMLILSVAAIGYGQTTFYFPQVANGLQGGVVKWRTTIFITNPAASGTASGTISFFQDTGTAVATFPSPGTAFNSIVLTDETGATANSGNSIPFQIAAGYSKKYVSTGDGNYQGGFALVQSNATVNGTAIFSQFDASGTNLLGEAGVPASPAVPKQILFADTLNNYDVGFALANPQASQVTVTLTLLNTMAQQVATTTRSLGSNNHFAQFIGDVFPTAPKLTGTMQISGGSASLTTVALRFGPGYAVFTSLPPVTIASLLFEPMNALQRLVGTLFRRIPSMAA